MGLGLGLSHSQVRDLQPATNETLLGEPTTNDVRHRGTPFRARERCRLHNRVCMLVSFPAGDGLGGFRLPPTSA